ncbi:hypothetical protein FRB95_004114 [Tulasnella sp. JGI-2019a]|nr:hypothetical protein FRB95_004114 [Tulasnella sp. JGI-2019a]
MSSVSASEIHLGSEKSIALQDAIQKQLALKGYSQEDDTVMAEYITIMLVNDKSAEQVTLELTELIGDYDPSFTDLLFAAKNNPNLGVNEPTAPLNTSGGQNTADLAVSNATPTSNFDTRHSRPLYQQAISALPSGSTGQKRSASQRSLSPTSGGPSSKRRQPDLPDRPRAMRDENPTAGATAPVSARGNRLKNSLLDRVGPKASPNGPDPVQERIRSVTQPQQPLQQRSQGPGGPNMHNLNPQMGPNMQPGGGGFPGGQMDPAAMAMMMQQGYNPAMMNGGFAPNGIEATMMAIQQFGQLAMQMGLVPGPMGMVGPGPMQQPGGGHGGPRFQGDRGMGGGPGMGGRHNGGQRNVPVAQGPPGTGNQRGPGPSSATGITTIHSPTPIVPATTSLPNSNVPLRPLSPTLCKFVTNCNNPTCRYSHPSPVSTMESGVVLSTEPCEKGVNCLDKDCIYAHVSKAAKNAPKSDTVAAPIHTPAAATVSQAPCKFDPNCTRPNCPYYHPSHKQRAPKPYASSSSTACRFGAGCTRADCPYTHPPGRILPSQFSRGLDGAPPSLVITASGNEKESWNKSVDFRAKNAASATPATTVVSVEGKTNRKLNAAAPPFAPSSVHAAHVSPAPAADPVEAA